MPQQEVPTKTKKQLSPEKLEQLKQARLKGAEKKKEMKRETVQHQMYKAVMIFLFYTYVFNIMLQKISWNGYISKMLTISKPLH